MNYKIALIRGDGIGPEIVNEAVGVLDRVGERFGHSFAYVDVLMGGCATDAVGKSYPDGTAEWGTIEDRYDLYLTVEGTGVITASRQYMINKTYQINVGAQKNMNTQFRSFYGRIMSVS